MAVFSPELIPIHERLVNIRRQLVALAAKETAQDAGHGVFAVNLKDAYPMRIPAQNNSTPSLIGDPSSGPNSSPGSETDPKTPTKESTPKPDNPKEREPKVKSELKVLQEELRKIDGLSVLFALLFIYGC